MTLLSQHYNNPDMIYKSKSDVFVCVQLVWDSKEDCGVELFVPLIRDADNLGSEQTLSRALQIFIFTPSRALVHCHMIGHMTPAPQI